MSESIPRLSGETLPGPINEKSDSTEAPFDPLVVAMQVLSLKEADNQRRARQADAEARRKAEWAELCAKHKAEREQEKLEARLEREAEKDVFRAAMARGMEWARGFKEMDREEQAREKERIRDAAETVKLAAQEMKAREKVERARRVARRYTVEKDEFKEPEELMF